MPPAPYPDFDGSQPCASMNAELFYPRSPTNPPHPAAKAACARCPFLRQCLAYALTHAEHGIWAGTSEDDRHRLRKQHGITAVTPSMPDWRPSAADQVLEMARTGMTRTEIAEELGLTITSVDHYLNGR